MKYPCLVPKRLCKTQVHIEFTEEEVTEYGEPIAPVQFDGKCNYQDRARTVLTADRKLVEISGTALFPGDICPELAVISGGEAMVYGQKRRVSQGRKVRNPDGTVNYTEVMLV